MKLKHSFFVEKSILTISNFVREWMSPNHQNQNSTIDPRVMIVLVLCSVCTITIIQSFIIMFIYHFVILIFTIAYKIKLKLFIKQTYIAGSLLTVIIGLPIIFFPWKPNDIPFFTFHIITIYISGVIIFLKMFLRVTGSIAPLSILLLTIPWNQILESINTFKFPSSLTAILFLMWRFLIEIALHAEHLMYARLNRLTGPIKTSDERFIVGSIGGSLLIHTLNHSENIAMALNSRGFRGSWKTLPQNSLTYNQLHYFILTILVMGLLIFFDTTL
jgi:cobalt/nickel transport system permease protein